MSDQIRKTFLSTKYNLPEYGSEAKYKNICPGPNGMVANKKLKGSIMNTKYQLSVKQVNLFTYLIGNISID